MALNGEREKYFGELLQREEAALDALCRAPGADSDNCGSSPKVCCSRPLDLTCRNAALRTSGVLNVTRHCHASNGIDAATILAC